MAKPKQERRTPPQTVPVRDRIAEIGINLNTLFTALILAGILWVGTTLEKIQSSLSALNTSVAVVQHDNNQMRLDLKEHMLDPYAHRRIGK